MPAPRDLDAIMRTLADPTRRAVFEKIVAGGEVPAGALARRADVSQPAISQHLRALRENGLVARRRDGRKLYYRPEPDALAPIVDWLETYGVFWRERFARLQKLLQEIDPHGGQRQDP
jgi:DNA-binding transcriptional ArsR family regulator